MRAQLGPPACKPRGCVRPEPAGTPWLRRGCVRPGGWHLPTWRGGAGSGCLAVRWWLRLAVAVWPALAVWLVRVLAAAGCGCGCSAELLAHAVQSGWRSAGWLAVAGCGCSAEWPALAVRAVRVDGCLPLGGHSAVLSVLSPQVCSSLAVKTAELYTSDSPISCSWGSALHFHFPLVVAG